MTPTQAKFIFRESTTRCCDHLFWPRGNPKMFLPLYDSCDHLHPSDAGYKAMADATDLSLFKQYKDRKRETLTRAVAAPQFLYRSRSSHRATMAAPGESCRRPDMFSRLVLTPLPPTIYSPLIPADLMMGHLGTCGDIQLSREPTLRRLFVP
jgi:hypothetical protein